MKYRLLLLAATLSIFGSATLVSATTIIDLYGDQDGFGIGASWNQAFSYNSIVANGDEGFTDQWVTGAQSYTHTFDYGLLNGPATSAYLELFTGGQGMYDNWFGLTKISINNQDMGTLTDGDHTEYFISTQLKGNYARMDIFDLLTLNDLPSGSLDITVDVQYCNDSWVLDYSKLSISDTPTGPTPVPEPLTMVLFGSGLLGISGLKRKKI